MTRILTVVGARPQIIKYSSIPRAAQQEWGSSSSDPELFLVHTGQHYDPRMSQIFFDELALPCPDINLEIGSLPPGPRE